MDFKIKKEKKLTTETHLHLKIFKSPFVSDFKSIFTSSNT